MQKLKYKDDFEEVKKYFSAFWEGEIIDRPILILNIPKTEKEILPPYISGYDGDFKTPCEKFEEYCENTIFFAESLPFFRPYFGPDQIVYFLNIPKIEIVFDNRTAWVKPFVERWDDIGKLEIDKENEWFKKFIEFHKFASIYGDGKFLISVNDLHTHLEILRAIRGSENLCIDLIERPEVIKNKLEQIKDIFIEIYETLYIAGNMKKWGTGGWIPFYCEGKFAVIQCDFICMIGPEMFRKFALPYIEYEANYLDHSIFHLDGPGALKHLDDILSIKKLNAIQWVPGAGNKPHIYWIELFKKIIKAKKSVIIYPQSVEELKIFHKELGPKRVVYQFGIYGGIKNLKEAEELKKWLIKNT
jgi:hypothetical protein